MSDRSRGFPPSKVREAVAEAIRTGLARILDEDGEVMITVSVKRGGSETPRPAPAPLPDGVRHLLRVVVLKVDADDFAAASCEHFAVGRGATPIEAQEALGEVVLELQRSGALQTLPPAVEEQIQALGRVVKVALLEIGPNFLIWP